MKLADVVVWLGKVFSKLPGPVQAGFVGLLIAIGPVASVLGYFANGVGKTLIVTAKFLQFIKGFAALRAGVGAIEALKIAMAGFGITLRGIMVTTGIGLAIAAIILLNEKFHFLGPTVEFITKILGKAFAWIKTAAGNVLGWVKSNWPLLLGILTGPIGLAVALIVKHWDAIKGAVTGAINTVLGFVKSHWMLILGIITGPFGLAVALTIKYWDKIKGAIHTAVGAVFGFLRSHWKTIVAILLGPFAIAVKLILDHWRQIKSMAASAVSFVVGKFTAFVGFFASIPGRIASVAKGMFNGIKGAFRGAINWIIDKWNNLELRIGGISIDPPGPGSISIPSVSLKTPDIPRLAGGGNVLAPGMVEVGERGPEILQLPRAARVSPLERRVHRIETSKVGGGVKTIIAQTLLDRKVLAESVVDVAEDAEALA
jgi:hypothetical protein